MAIKFFDCHGFGQIEPNQVWFTRAGMIEAQCALDPEKFASHFPMTDTEATTGKIYGENGSFYVVDKVKKIVTIPTKALSDKGYPMGINYSTEKILIYKTLSVYFLLKSKEISFSFISECIAVALGFCFTIDGLCDFSVKIDVFWRYSVRFSINDEYVFPRFCISFYFVTITHDFCEIHGSS